ncbi:23S rRNA methyltransferase [Halobacillus andaensis]|uniref:23S rRNA methyltransferase n=1 Tax=Halobacillus andaensis TaxID=1176239 RepID=A0A917EUG5_HALAA|nr:RNA methyltransferase [Halobacillus andaensis]MBP2002894.1 TrmH family RNA methyltransferase [Halobacillus andaensis]GGF06456.1 23S rRNA methyltransferase [Halobacillus andaensis]
MLTSLTNPKVKEWKKLQKRKYRERNGLFLVEGHHLVEEAIKSEWTVREIILREEASLESVNALPVTYVSDQVFNEIAETQTPQGVAAVIEFKDFTYEPAPYSLLIDSVQDPGNLGTLIRTADAAGFNQVIVGRGSVDVFNEKVVRATQGSLFHLPVIQAELEEVIPYLKENNVSVYAATLEDSVPYKHIETQSNVALLVGNEGQGIREEILNHVDQNVNIPIYGEAESLNVAIAAAILMYHFKA